MTAHIAWLVIGNAVIWTVFRVLTWSDRFFLDSALKRQAELKIVKDDQLRLEAANEVSWLTAKMRQWRRLAVYCLSAFNLISANLIWNKVSVGVIIVIIGLLIAASWNAFWQLTSEQPELSTNAKKALSEAVIIAAAGLIVGTYVHMDINLKKSEVEAAATAAALQFTEVMACPNLASWPCYTVGGISDFRFDYSSRQQPRMCFSVKLNRESGGPGFAFGQYLLNIETARNICLDLEDSPWSRGQLLEKLAPHLDNRLVELQRSLCMEYADSLDFDDRLSCAIATKS